MYLQLYGIAGILYRSFHFKIFFFVVVEIFRNNQTSHINDISLYNVRECFFRRLNSSFLVQ